ncbi:MAG: ABC transporter permease [Schleiferilactobacillus harbinensis]|jgi:putative ABC transport system permease protein|nr:ABC transporter permease [Schleiferilactobacillus harbinensis]
MFLASKEILHNKARYLLVVVTFVLISYLVFFLTGLATGLARNNRTAIDALPGNYVLMSKYANKNLLSSVVTEDQYDQVASKDTALLGQMTIVAENPKTNKKLNSNIFGINLQGKLKPTVTSGRLPTKNSEVLADDSVTYYGLKRGDHITLNGSNQKYHIVGLTHDRRFATVPVFYTTLATFRQVKYGQSRVHNVSAVVSTRKMTDLPKHTEQITRATLINNIPGYTAQTSTFMLMIGAMIGITLLIIGIFMYILTIQKVAMYGVMRAQGIRTSAIIAALFWQILILAVVGVGIGVGLLALTEVGLPKTIPFYSDTMLLSMIAGALIIMSLVGGLFSLRRILHIDPLEAIGGE